MSLRFKSLDELGRGAWKIASEMPMNRPGRTAPRTGPTPHDLLWDAVKIRWPEAVRELEHVVPGRKFRLDIGFLQERLAIEVDGFAHHGKRLADFKRDRERQNELVIAGWKVLRFSAGEIRKDLAGCVRVIERALNLGVA